MRRLICMCGGMALVACGSSNDGPVGGPVAGAADIHCGQTDGGVRAQPINLSSCLPTGADAGALDYGATMYNAEADDDDCKYHVKFTTTAVRQKSNVNFTVTATAKATGVAATSAKVLAEVYLSDTHPAPNTNQ